MAAKCPAVFFPKKLYDDLHADYIGWTIQFPVASKNVDFAHWLLECARYGEDTMLMVSEWKENDVFDDL